MLHLGTSPFRKPFTWFTWSRTFLAYHSRNLCGVSGEGDLVRFTVGTRCFSAFFFVPRVRLPSSLPLMQYKWVSAEEHLRPVYFGYQVCFRLFLFLVSDFRSCINMSKWYLSQYPTYMLCTKSFYFIFLRWMVRVLWNSRGISVHAFESS